MFDNTQSQWVDTSAASGALDHSVPKHHSADPFACPCCANVFAETLRLSGVDLAEQAGRFPKVPGLPSPAPVLVTGAHIITMNAQAPIAEAMLVRDGRITWLGRLVDAPEAAEGVERLELDGKVVVPGFVEPHMHLPPLAMMHDFSNIGPNRFETTDAALAQLAKDAKATP